MDVQTVENHVTDYLTLLILSQYNFPDQLYYQAKQLLHLIVQQFFTINNENIVNLSQVQVEETCEVLLNHLRECLKEENSAAGVVQRLHVEWVGRRISHFSSLCYEFEHSSNMSPEKQHRLEMMAKELKEQAKLISNPNISSLLLKNLRQIISYHVVIFGLAGLEL